MDEVFIAQGATEVDKAGLLHRFNAETKGIIIPPLFTVERAPNPTLGVLGDRLFSRQNEASLRPIFKNDANCFDQVLLFPNKATIVVQPSIEEESRNFFLYLLEERMQEKTE